MKIKNEYPRPQLVRSQWQNLNGTWQFDYDDENRGVTDKWYNGKELGLKITVPFVYQAECSGIGDTTPHDIVWYHTKFAVEHFENGKRVILHFGAADYETHVYVNRQLATFHCGGYTPFCVDITDILTQGMQDLCVRVYDPHADELIPRGKQFWEEKGTGIWYTNSTGIWQTVWLECVSYKHIENLYFTPLFDDGKVNIKCSARKVTPTDTLAYEIRFKGETVCRGEQNWQTGSLDWDVDLLQNHIFRTNFHGEGCAWTPESPNLFDVALRIMENGEVMRDSVSSYFGFRKIHAENGLVYLNNKPYYFKMVLDQGYWPDGLLTAPSDRDFICDIELAKQMGFNGCRKHQKMEDPRFLYWADKMGYLVWGECASFPMYSSQGVSRLLREWDEVVERDYNHPCIVVWIPLNESWGVPAIHRNRMQQHFSQAIYHYLHAIDGTRLVVSNDGWEMTDTDICSIHNYRHGTKEDQNTYEEYKATLSTRENLIGRPSACWDIFAKGFSYRDQPIILTEFGGIGYDVSGTGGWGYTTVKDKSDYISEYRRIMAAVSASRGLSGYCYTQLYDVEQEKNGILTYRRKPKCELSDIKDINNTCSLVRE